MSGTGSSAAGGPGRDDAGGTGRAANPGNGLAPGQLRARARRLAARAGWYPFTRIAGGVGQGLRISLRLASADYSAGTNELPVQEALAEHLRPGGVFCDVGSNVGFFALIAARLVGPGGRVYACEPVPEIAACIRANAARNGFGHLEVLEVAVGAEPGRAELVLTAHPGGATLAADAAPDPTGRLAVEVASIDALVASGRMAAPTVVKIDVEGVELEALAGMAATLGRAAPVVVCELDDATREGAHRKLAAWTAAMAEHGYSVRTLAESYAGMGWNVVHTVAARVG